MFFKLLYISAILLLACRTTYKTVDCPAGSELNFTSYHLNEGDTITYISDQGNYRYELIDSLIYSNSYSMTIESDEAYHCTPQCTVLYKAAPGSEKYYSNWSMTIVKTKYGDGFSQYRIEPFNVGYQSDFTYGPRVHDTISLGGTVYENVIHYTFDKNNPLFEHYISELYLNFHGILAFKTYENEFFIKSN